MPAALMYYKHVFIIGTMIIIDSFIVCKRVNSLTFELYIVKTFFSVFIVLIFYCRHTTSK